jgi:pimeloyl-ACP methyl ester carboxylesterase
MEQTQTNRVQAVDHFITVNNINLHYIEYPSDGPVILIMHGLTANAHAFDGLVGAGLSPAYRVISPDLRGRGLSEHPAFRYSIEDHARDIIGLLSHLKIKKVVLAGHSFGGLLAFYISVTYPQLVDKLIIIDAAAEMNPNAPQMLSFAMGRFNITYPSFDEYIETVKKAPYNTFWDAEMMSYYRADVRVNPDGTVRPLNNLTDILEISYSVFNISWPYYVQRVVQPAILLNAEDDYTLRQPLLPDNQAKASVAMMKNAKYVPIWGNHQTMIYGKGAKQIVAAIKVFLA